MLKTHLAFALLCWITVSAALPDTVSRSLVGLSLVLLASVVPDIDSHKSFVGRLARPLSDVIEGFAQHRGVLHSMLLPSAACFALIIAGYKQLAFPLFLGYCSHIIADALTSEGVAPFSPISGLRIHGLFSTGGLLEYVVFVSLVVVNGALLLGL